MSDIVFDYGVSPPGTSAYQDPALEELSHHLALIPGTPWSTGSRALVASVVIYPRPCRLFGFQGFSNKGAAQFVQLFDLASVPADGAVPDEIVNVSASSNYSFSFGAVGRWMYRGVVLCNSSTAATKTLGSADTWFSAQYL